MWDERYAGEEYAYGTEPNQFLAERFRAIPMGRVRCVAGSKDNGFSCSLAFTFASLRPGGNYIT